MSTDVHTSDFATKTALIVGGSRGVGRKTAERLAQLGTRVLLVGRNAQTLSALTTLLNKEFPHKRGHRELVADVCEPMSLKKLITDIAHESIDFCLHNVGGSPVREPLCEYAQLAEVLRINLESIVEINRVLIPKMQAAGFGRIVQISSNAATKPYGALAYGVAKRALNAYTERLGKEVIGNGIAVIGIMPGPLGGPDSIWEQRLRENPTLTREFIARNLPTGEFQDPGTIADLVMSCFAQTSLSLGGTVLTADAAMGST